MNFNPKFKFNPNMDKPSHASWVYAMEYIAIKVKNELSRSSNMPYL